MYSKLRRLFKRTAIMQTASSYLFPWGMAKEIEEGIQQMNKDVDGFPLPKHLQIKYNIFKYDEKVSGDALMKSAEMALRKQLRSMKELINRKLMKLHEDEGTDDGDLKSAKVSCRRASNLAKDMKALALIFNLTDQIEPAILAYEAFIMAKKEEIQDWEEAAQAIEEEEAKLDDHEVFSTESSDSPEATTQLKSSVSI